MTQNTTQNMTALDTWLARATRHLSRDSAAQVRAEITQHYESARDAALAAGAVPDEAGRTALAALGKAKAANRQYCRVLITRAEARQLRSSGREAQFFCSSSFRKSLLVAIPVIAAICAAASYTFATVTGAFAAHANSTAVLVARVSVVAAVLTALFFAVPLLPIYTPMRARIYRAAKWLAIATVVMIIFDGDRLYSTWLFLSCFWVVAHTEAVRMSIRRKIPAANWPRHLYL
jgi:uncharacterized membrane protein YgdD (TMEM256/DUF423 family)